MGRSDTNMQAPRESERSANDDKPISAGTLIGFFAMVVGMFLALLDIQIVAASLGEIQAGLSAAPDEVSWIQTSYLIAEIIMIPLSGFLARVMSTRLLFALSAAGFTLTSLLCATAGSITEMIVWRSLQGFIGGGMIPLVFATAYLIFPPAKQGPVAAFIGLMATLASTIGPTIGGYITELYSWHWLFLMNIVPGTATAVLVYLFVDVDQPNWKLLDHLDYLGLAAMAAFLGTLQYVLEEGPRHDWWQSNGIVLFSAICLAAAVIFLWRAFTAPEPIVDLTAFADRNFAAGSALFFALGVGTYGLVYLEPLYLGRVRGMSAIQIGEVMYVTGLFMLFAAPPVGLLARKVDQRKMLAIGLIGFAWSTYLFAAVTRDWGGDQMFLPQMLRGVALMLCFVPVNIIALGTLPPERLKNASALFSLMRNLGGAIGLAGINTMLNQRWDVHLARMHEKVGWGRYASEEALGRLGFALRELGPDADAAALKSMSLFVRREALVLSFADVFLALAILLAVAAVPIVLLRKPTTLVMDAH